MIFLRSLLLLAVPGVLFLVALYLHLGVEVADEWQALFFLFPYLAVGAGLFLGWRFNRTRVLWAIVVLILVERALNLSTAFGREYVLQVVPVLVPLNLVFFCWWSERGLVTKYGAVRLVLLLSQLGLLTWLFFNQAGEVMAWLGRPLFNSDALKVLPFPQIAVLVMVLCLIALLLRFSRKPEALEGSFVWMLAAVIAGLWWPQSFTYWVGVAAFLLMVALIESSFKMAFNDELTGLPARRAMNEFLLKVGRRYTIAMVDVDHFKKVNDTHGHDVGDQVLRMVANCLRRVTGGGRAYRYGGEEFAVIFPSKDIERALPHLEELRETIAQASFVLRGRTRPKKKPNKPSSKSSGKAKLQVTVSIGVATRDEKNTTPEQLLKAADQALYKAKKGGRNQVCAV
jgi:diguanylate cyclase (GGDEF)-like protein